MRKFHIAIGVADIEGSVNDYSKRIGAEPVVVVPGEYALWRTAEINFSVRRSDDKVGRVRHIGWEDDAVEDFGNDIDHNGMMWESFSAQNQADEIHSLWPNADYQPK